MKKKLSSVLKLIFSLGLGVFLIWYFLNDIGKPKDTLANQDFFVATPAITLEEWVVEDGEYVYANDTIAWVDFKGGSFPLVAELEGVFEPSLQVGDKITEETVIGQTRIKIFKIIRRVFSQTNYFWIALSLMLAILSHSSRATRWRMMFKPLGYKPGWLNTFFSIMVMYLANLAFPRLGEVMRCGVMNRYEKIPIGQSLGTMVTARLLDGIMLLLVGASAFIAQNAKFFEFLRTNILAKSGAEDGGSGGAQRILISLALVAGLVLVVLLIRWWVRRSDNKIAQKIKDLGVGVVDGLKAVAKLEKPGWFIFHSVFIWVMYWMMTYTGLQALPETSVVTPAGALVVLFFGSFAIILTQGGLGAYPLLMSSVLLLYGVNASVGYAMGWVMWSAQTSLIIIGGFLSMLLLPALNEGKLGLATDVKAGEPKT